MKQLKIYTYAKKDFEEPKEKEEVNQLSKGFGEISLSDAKGNGFKLTYKSLAYDFRIYEPSEVHVTLLCTPNEGVTLSAQTMVSLLKAEFLPAQSTPQETVSVDVLAENDQELATNFYVHSFGFTSKKEPIEKKDEKTVKANVTYQAVYQVVLHCYSPDKKLTINKFCHVFCGKQFGADIFKKWTVEKFAFQADQLHYDVTELNQLSYEKKTKELVQPYLVQYNESYYDFLRRVAHRCGEFLYYREGKFYLGLPQPKDTPGAFSVAAECSYPEVVDEESIGVEVTSFSGDYVEDRDDETKDKWVYHAPYSGDENYHVLTDEDRAIFTDIWGDWVYFSAAFEALTGENIVEVVQNAATELATLGVGYGFVKKEVEDDYDEKYKKDYANKMGFTSLDVSNCSFLNQFYYQMEQAALKARQSLITLDCSNLLPKERLGDAFCLGVDTYYVVTRMQGSFGDTCVHRVEAVPASYINEQDHKGLTASPPLQQFPFCLKSAPQEAVVCDVADPLKMGRVRIRYLWQNGEDEVDSFSPWIRMVVPFASGSGGMVMTPQKGDHLMINFLGENIERPYAEGALYHKDQGYDSGSVTVIKKCFAPNYPARVISSANGHSISFIDLKGWIPFFSGMVPMAGQIMSLVKSCTDSKFDENESGDAMAGGIVLRDANDINNIQLSADGRFISISSPLGKVSINAFTGISIEAPNGNVSIKGKNITLEAGNNISLKAGGNIHDEDESVKNTIAGALGSFAGAVAKQTAKELIKWKLGKFDPWKLTDVSFLRAVWEVLMRPVEGSLKLQSNRNVVMTSGAGRACVPSSLMSSAGRFGLKKTQDIQKDKYANDKYVVGKLFLSKLKESIQDYCIGESAQYFHCQNKLNHLVGKLFNLTGYYKYIKNQYCETLCKSTIEEIRTALLDKLLAKEKIKPNDFIRMIVAHTEGERLAYNNAYKALNDFVKDYNGLVEKVESLIDRTKDGGALIAALNATATSLKDTYPKLKYQLPQKTAFSVGFLGYDLSQKANWEDIKLDWPSADVQKKITVTVFLEVLKHWDFLDVTSLQDATVGQLLADDMAAWREQMHALEEKKEEGTSFMKSLGVSVGNEFLGEFVEFSENGIKDTKAPKGLRTLFNYGGEAGPRSAWDIGTGGNILLSNSDSYTYLLNEDATGWKPLYNPGIDLLKDYLVRVFDADDNFIGKVE